MERRSLENGDHSDFLSQYKDNNNISNVNYDDGKRENEVVDLERDKNAMSPPSSWSCGGPIEHRVSKMDTLVGVAIKYGVEVADIKRMNGLVTDLQMFALKTLQIPLPGRHPPSPNVANGLDDQGLDEQTPTRRRNSDLFDSFHFLKPKSSSPKRVSPAMSSLQGYYGIKPAKQKTITEGFEMSVYHKDDDPFAQSSPLSNPPLSLHRKSKSVANGLFSENGSINLATYSAFGEGGSEKLNEKFIRRRQKSELDLRSPTPELLMEDNSSNGIGFSTIRGKGLALRSRTSSGVDTEVEKPNQLSGMGDSFGVERENGVRKSSSTSSLQDQESCTSSSSSIWPTTKWSLKPDLQALSAAAIARPIFDGLPKPMSGRKNKAALD